MAKVSSYSYFGRFGVLCKGVVATRVGWRSWMRSSWGWALIFMVSSSAVRAQVSLSIETLPNVQVRIAWPEGGSFELETAAGLDEPWGASSFGAQVVGGQRVVELSPTDATRFFRLKQVNVETLAILSTSPSQGETGVAVTRETIFRLNRSLAADTLLATNHVSATAAGRRILSRVELSSDRRAVTLFYLEPLPADARVEVRFDGTGLFDESNRPIDLDHDGIVGGTARLVFETLSTVALSTTGIEGHVFASEKDSTGTSRPLQNVTITVDGMEESLRTTTDSNGFFRLQPCPPGRFFVSVDGRTAAGSQWPDGAYYPFVGKAWEAVPGRTNNLAGGSGVVFLPLIQADALTNVSSVSPTRITFAPSLLATNPALAGVEIVVPANSLFSDSGQRGGQVGIAPVPPDRLPEPLPPGLDFPLVITIQTDGPTNFDLPVPVKFPNLPDPVTGMILGPGEKTVLWSFNHDTGRWEPQGTMTISADGKFAVTDPGVGVRQPGWHGAAPGSPGGGGPPPGPPCRDDCDDDSSDDDAKRCKNEMTSAVNSAQDCLVGAFAPSTGFGTAKSGCIFGLGTGVFGAGRDCALDPASCTPTLVNAGGGAGIGCVEFVGKLLGKQIAKVGPWAQAAGLIHSCVLGAGLNACALYDCMTPGGDAACLPDAIEDDLDDWLEEIDLIGKIFGGVPNSLSRQAATADLPPARANFLTEAGRNAFITQVRFSESLRRFLAAMYGTEIWFSRNAADGETSAIFLQALSEALEETSAGGETLTEAEKISLRALGRPAGATDADVEAVMSRMEKLILGTATAPEVNGTQIVNEGLRFAEMVAVYQQLGWTHPHAGARHGLIQLTEQGQRFCRAQSGGALGGVIGGGGNGGGGGGDGSGGGAVLPGGGQPTQQRTLTFLLRNFDTGFEQRGKTRIGATFDNLILSPNSFYGIFVTDDQTGVPGVAFFESAPAGQRTIIPCAVWLDGELVLPDADSDGLPDLSEMVVGSDGNSADSDSDGVSDGAEMAFGTNPLDGQPLGFGPVATRDTAGTAVDIDTVNDLAVVADSSGGIAVFDVANPLAPLLLNQIVLAGVCSSVATAGDIVVTVPGGSSSAAGVHLFRLGADGTLTAGGYVSVGGTPNAVAAAGRYAYAPGRSANVATVAVVLLNGVVLRHVPIPGGSTITALAIDGDVLWATSTTGLFSFRISGDNLVPLGELALSGLTAAPLEPGLDLTAGNGRVYVGGFQGFRVYDAVNPSTPSQLYAPSTTQAAIHDLALNGSGWMIPVTSFSGSRTLALSIYDIRDDRSTNFLVSFDTPGETRAVVLHRGYALAADAAAGLAVVNFLAPDRGTNPPSITLRAFPSHPPAAQEAEELFFLSTITSDDTQVRDVEFYFDGRLAGRSGKFPFATTVRAPSKTADKTNLVLRAKATDTGGRTAWSQEITLTLLPDVTAPRLTAFSPTHNSTLARGSVSRLSANFDSAMNLTSLTNGWTLSSAGVDGNHGTGDDVAVSSAGITFDFLERTAYLQFAAPLFSGKYRARLAASVADLGGNIINTNLTWDFAIAHARSVAVAPVDKSVWLPGTLQHFEARFDERLTPASVTPDSLRVVNTVNPVNPVILSGGVTSLSADGRGAILDLPEALGNGVYRLQFTRDIKDVYGSPVETNLSPSFTVKGPTYWTNDASGLWPAAANWSNGVAPILNDHVIIDRPSATPTVSLRTSAAVTTIRSEEAFALDSFNGNLTVHDRAIFNGPLVMSSGSRIQSRYLESRGEANLISTIQIGEEAVFAEAVTVDLAGDFHLQGGRSTFLDRLDIRRNTSVNGHVLTLAAGAVGTLGDMQVQFGGLNSRFVVEAGARLEINPTNTTQAGGHSFVGSQGESGSRVENAGEFVKRGAASSHFLRTELFNTGQISVEQGRLSVGNNFTNAGIIAIASDARLEVGSDFYHTSTGRIAGAGYVKLTDRAVLDGAYEVTGTTEITRAQSSAQFNAPIRSTGAWLISGSATFNGSTTELLGPVTIDDGRANLNSPGETILRDLRIDGTAVLGGSGQLVFREETALTATLQILDELRVRFEAPVNFTTNFTTAASGRVDLLANSRWTGGGGLSGNIHLASNVVLEVAITNTGGLSLVFPHPGILRKTGSGAVSVQAYSTSAGTGVTNRSLIDLLAGAISITSLNGTFFIQEEGGVLRMAPGTSLTTDALRLRGGELTGSGRISVRSSSNNRGCHLAAMVNPGEPYGVLEFAGVGFPNWLTGSRTIIDIGGTTPGIDHDQIAVERTIDIDGGTLEIRTAAGFTPTLGQEFTIFTGSGRSGTFPEVTGLELGNGRRYRVIYEPQAIKLRVE